MIIASNILAVVSLVIEWYVFTNCGMMLATNK